MSEDSRWVVDERSIWCRCSVGVSRQLYSLVCSSIECRKDEFCWYLQKLKPYHHLPRWYSTMYRHFTKKHVLSLHIPLNNAKLVKCDCKAYLFDPLDNNLLFEHSFFGSFFYLLKFSHFSSRSRWTISNYMTVRSLTLKWWLGSWRDGWKGGRIGILCYQNWCCLFFPITHTLEPVSLISILQEPLLPKISVFDLIECKLKWMYFL